VTAAALHFLPIVTPDEKKRLEELAYQQGSSASQFMQSAGVTVADVVTKVASAPVVTLLVGKGNNGGDAYACGTELLSRGFDVVAVHPFPLESCSPLCQQEGKRFVVAGGKVDSPRDALASPTLRGVVVDGLFGTGLHGQVEGVAARLIELANQSGLKIIAIDIPSGLSGASGSTGGPTIRAHHTVYLELPVIGFFLGEGWESVGQLHRGRFGLPEALLAHAVGKFDLLLPFASPLLPQPKRRQHKYDAGYICAFAGSFGMAGAADLATLAALRSGAGIVRLFYQEEMFYELSTLAPEVIKEMWGWDRRERFLIEARRAKSLLLGPGIGRASSAEKLLQWILKTTPLPSAIDADALFWLAHCPRLKLPAGSVLTPHHGEMMKLLRVTEHLREEELWSACQKFAEKRETTLLLKGAPTLVFHPGRKPVLMPWGDPGMATAGSGDVLTGILAAMLAKGLPPQEAALRAAGLHALAGEAAASKLGSHSLIASDLIDNIATVLREQESRSI